MHQTLVHLVTSKLKKNLSKSRYDHVISVKNTACSLAKKYQLNLETITLASLFHDFAKYFTSQELHQYCQKHSVPIHSFLPKDLNINSHAILHGPVASHIASHSYQITNLNILNPISYHTTGRPNMSIYEEVLFVADSCEPLRPNQPQSQNILQSAFSHLSLAVFQVCSLKLLSVIKKNQSIHPLSFQTYHSYLSKIQNYPIN